MSRRKVTSVGAVLGVIVFIIIGLLIVRYIPTKERMSLTEYFNINEDTLENAYALTIKNQVMDQKALKEEGKFYIDLNTVNDYLNSRFYYDGTQIIFTTPTQIITVLPEEMIYRVDGVEEGLPYVPVIRKNDQTVYIALDFIKQFTNLTFKVDSSPNRIWIWNEYGEAIRYSTVAKNTSIRYKGGIKSKIVKDVLAGDQVIVIEEVGKWTKVQSDDGIVGYIKSDMIGQISEKMITNDFEELEYTSITKDYKISMAWHQSLESSGIAGLSQILDRATGLNTISPTWFTLVDEKGNFESRADKAYVNQAHEAGVEVWALVDNINVPIDSHALLSNTEARTNLIEGLMQAVEEFDLDGINVDFESIKEETGKHYIQFIRELSVACRNAGIVLSIDNYAPTVGTYHYDRKEQGVVADYVIIMGYDEHWSGGDSAGSSASLPFVKKGIEDTLKEVPSEKVINALPFFTRLWCETPEEMADGNAKIITNSDSKYKTYALSSVAKGMKAAKEILQEHSVTPVWLEEEAQYYGEYEYENRFYRIWVEDERSIQEKLNIMKAYNLAGVSAWKLGLEDEGIWTIIDQYVKGE